MNAHEHSLRLTQAISRYIIEQAPYIEYTEAQLRKAETGWTKEEKQVLREAGWLKDDFECFYVIDRFIQALGIPDQADDAFLQQLYGNARKLDKAWLQKDAYLSNVHVPDKKIGRFQLRQATYARGEILQYDMPALDQPVVVPRLGFFTSPVSFPAVYEGNMPWVSVCPSEINSMMPDVSKAFGNTLVLGLGLGWYPYQISLLDQVRTVTVIERQQEIIDLFEAFILPQFTQKEKIRVIRADAFDYMPTVKENDYDFCYADIWESQVDGADCYQKLLPYEKRLTGTKFAYWIHKQILWQLRQEGKQI